MCYFHATPFHVDFKGDDERNVMRIRKKDTGDEIGLSPSEVQKKIQSE